MPTSRPLSPYRSLLTLLTFTIALALAAEEPVKGPERWNKDMAAFDARDAKTPPPDDALLFIGSSSIRMWDLKTSWPGEAAINNGFGGSTLADSIHHFERLIPPYQTRAIVVYAGDNDMKLGLSPAEVARDFKALFDLINQAKPGVPVIFVAIKPSVARWNLWPEMKAANDEVAALCKAHPNLYFADIAAAMLTDEGQPPSADWFKSDGLHLSPFGYEKWTAVVNEQLKAAEAR